MAKIIGVGLIVLVVFLTIFLRSTAGRLILFNKLDSWKYNILGVETISIGNETKPEAPLINSPLPLLGISEKLPISPDQLVAVIIHAFYPVYGLAVVDRKNNFVSWLPNAKVTPLGQGQWDSMGEVLDWWRLGYFNNNDPTEYLAAQFGIAGTALVHPFYLYTYDEDKGFRLLLKLVEAGSQTDIADLDGDGNKEIIYEYSLSGIGMPERDLLRWKDIWRIENGEVKKVNNQFPWIYKKLQEIHVVGLTKKEWEPEVEQYYPILSCLREKAGLTALGVLVEVDDCRS